MRVMWQREGSQWTIYPEGEVQFILPLAVCSSEEDCKSIVSAINENESLIKSLQESLKKYSDALKIMSVKGDYWICDDYLDYIKEFPCPELSNGDKDCMRCRQEWALNMAGGWTPEVEENNGKSM